MQAASPHGLVPILCVGEGLEVRQAGEHVAHTTAQLDAALEGVTADRVAAGRRRRRRDRLRARVGDRHGRGRDPGGRPGGLRRTPFAARQRFGPDRPPSSVSSMAAVKAANTAGILAGPDVDGALVGGASLDADEFAQICRTQPTAAELPLTAVGHTRVGAQQQTVAEWKG